MQAPMPVVPQVSTAPRPWRLNDSPKTASTLVFKELEISSRHRLRTAVRGIANPVRKCYLRRWMLENLGARPILSKRAASSTISRICFFPQIWPFYSSTQSKQPPSKYQLHASSHIKQIKDILRRLHFPVSYLPMELSPAKP
jgi:hypothetical protein